MHVFSGTRKALNEAVLVSSAVSKNLLFLGMCSSVSANVRGCPKWEVWTYAPIRIISEGQLKILHPFSGLKRAFSNRALNYHLLSVWRWNTDVHFMDAITEPLAKSFICRTTVLMKLKLDSHSIGWLARPIRVSRNMFMPRAFSRRDIHFQLDRSFWSSRCMLKECLPFLISPL